MSERRRRFEAQALPHLDAAYNLARWLARPPLDAEDIVQDAIVRAYRAFDSVRGDDVKPWLLSIVRNCFFTAAQQAQRKVTVPLPEDQDIAGGDQVFTAGDPDPEMALLQVEQSRRLNAMIAALPQEFREVLVLREMEDMSYREIARIADVPIGTVMSRLARARVMLKEKWRGDTEGAAYVLR